MFLPANLVYRLAHMLQDVEAVVDDLVLRKASSSMPRYRAGVTFFLARPRRRLAP